MTLNKKEKKGAKRKKQYNKKQTIVEAVILTNIAHFIPASENCLYYSILV